MHKFNKLVVMAALFGVIVAINAKESAAATGTASVTTTVVAPITISKETDLQFGKVYLTPAGMAGGDYVLNSSTGVSDNANVKAFSQGGNTATPARFTVSGTAASIFSISLPVNGAVALTGAGNPIVVNNFESDAGGATGTLIAGVKVVHVGATMTIGAAQTPGAYAGSFDVTVDYN